MAWEWLEKYLKGTTTPQFSTMEQPHSGIIDVGSTAPKVTQGLFGAGGEYGTGGLLTTFNQNPNASNNMFQMLSNPAVGIGASIFTKGMEGKDIGTSAFPSIKEGISFSESISKINTARKQRDFINKYKDKVPPEDMEMFLAFPQKYMAGLIGKKFRTSKRTVSDEALAVYDKVKGLDTKAFNDVWKTLSKAERSLYNNKIKGNEDYFEAMITGKMEELNTPIVLDDTGKPPNPNELTKHQIYQIGNKFYRWDGEDMKLVPPPQ